MKTIGKAIAVGGVLAALGIGGLQALAAAPSGSAIGPATMGGGMMGGGMMGTGFTDPAAQLSAWKSEIGIKPDQQAAWDTYAAAVKESAAKLAATHGAMVGVMGRDVGTIQQLCIRQAQSFSGLRAAATTLLGSLDATQAARARTILPGLAFPHGMMSVGMM
ncbi:MAG: hypothetical protein M0002_18175 [Rhodospirillales bacterium]|nr:hypothetical protein [Rhodospirillales bacterium]